MLRNKVGQANNLLHNNSQFLADACTLDVIANQGYGVTLEKRRGQRYFYTAERCGSRVVKKYLGKADEFGSLIAGLTALTKQEQRALRTERQVLRLRLKGLWDNRFAALDDYLTLSYSVFAACMAAAGYHRPKRGIWRRRREAVTMMTERNCRNSVEIKDDLPMANEIAPIDPKVEAQNNQRMINAAIQNPKDADLGDKAIAILCSPSCNIGTHLADDMHAVVQRFADDNPVSKEVFLNQAHALW